MLQRKDEDETCYKLSKVICGKEIYEECKKPVKEWRDVMIERKENREVIVYSVMLPAEYLNERRDYSLEFAEGMKIAVRERKAHAASDTLMKYNQMG